LKTKKAIQTEAISSCKRCGRCCRSCHCWFQGWFDNKTNSCRFYSERPDLCKIFPFCLDGKEIYLKETCSYLKEVFPSQKKITYKEIIKDKFLHACYKELKKFVGAIYQEVYEIKYC